MIEDNNGRDNPEMDRALFNSKCGLIGAVVGALIWSLFTGEWSLYTPGTFIGAILGIAVALILRTRKK